MMKEEFNKFLQTWDDEAALTVKVMQSIPSDQYDFRPAR
jgi:hypothetical protein